MCANAHAAVNRQCNFHQMITACGLLCNVEPQELVSHEQLNHTNRLDTKNRCARMCTLISQPFICSKKAVRVQALHGKFASFGRLTGSFDCGSLVASYL